MIRPDDDSKSFQRRWNTLVRILLVESSVKLVARTAMDYADWDDGSNVRTGNIRMALNTGYSDKTIRTAWAVLRGIGMVERIAWSSSGKRFADVYNLVIPTYWSGLPVLGPHEQQFRCIQCGKLFMPSNSIAVLRDDGSVGWHLYKAAFCPPPRAKKGQAPPESCLDVWDTKRKRDNDPPWRRLDSKACWKLFGEARGDDW